MTTPIRAPAAALARWTFALLSVGVAITASTAQAAFGERDVNDPYIGLGDAGSSLNGVSGIINGLTAVQLNGWSFPFAGQTYSEITVTSDGYLAVGNATATCGCASTATHDDCNNCPSSPPAAGPYGYSCQGNNCGYTLSFQPPFSPGLIAPWWEDFSSTVDNYCDGTAAPTTPNGTISTLQAGVAGSQYLIVDYVQVGPFICEYTYTGIPPYYETCAYYTMPKTFQVQLFESGAIVFTYGTMDGVITLPNGGQYDDSSPAIIGVWAPAEFDAGLAWTDAGSMFGPSGTDSKNGCMIIGWENYSDYDQFCYPYIDASTLGSAYIGELNAPFLTSSPAPLPQATANGVVVNMTLTINNNGASAQASGFPVDFFLVQQGEPPFNLPATCSGQYCLGGPSAFGDPIPANGQATYSVPTQFALPSPLPARGYYAVASVIDPDNTTVNATAPLLEIGTSAQLLPFGQDLTGKIDVTSFSAVNPTEFTVPIEFTNIGLEQADSATYTLSFVDGAGNLIPGASGTVSSLGGLTSELVDVDVPIPAGLDAGQYQLELQISAGTPVDLDMKNNTILGIQHVENGQDMTATISSIPFAIPTPTTFSVPVEFHNLGLQPATNIPWTVFLIDAKGFSHQVGGGEISLAGLTVDDEDVTVKVSQTLPAGPYLLSLSIGTNSVSGTSPPTRDLDVSNNVVIDPSPIFVYSSGADYAVGPGDLVLNASSHAADGQVIGVARTIHNLEGAAGPCPYGYYLNPITVFQIGNGVPAAILTKTGATYLGTTPPFAALGQPGAQNTSTDQIIIPAGIPPGQYNIVLALDPQNQVADSNPSNNDTAVAINIAANPLQITSPSSLTAAIVGTPYVNALTEQGAGTQMTWSLLAGSLPPGIVLNPAGQLTGKPTAPGVFTLIVQLESQGGTQTAVLQLPVASGSGALSVETSGSYLPTASVGSLYAQQMQAQGGVPPYSWAGTIPQELGMNITDSGLLSGIPLQATDGPLQFTIAVTDAIGTKASATLTLQVVAPSGLAITTPYLEPAVVGMQYDQPILASDGNLSGSMLSLQWTLPPATVLPSGILFEEIGSPAVADLQGKPTQPGIFPIVFNLTDNYGHTATRQYILTVAAAPIPVGLQPLPVAVIGETYGAELQANSLSTLTWQIFSGQLPPGLTLAPTGVIGGTVPTGTLVGSYPFSVAVTDSAGGESVVPLEIQVQAAPPPASGCATGGGLAGGAVFLLALTWLAARSRRRTAGRLS